MLCCAVSVRPCFFVHISAYTRLSIKKTQSFFSVSSLIHVFGWRFVSDKVNVVLYVGGLTFIQCRQKVFRLSSIKVVLRLAVNFILLYRISERSQQ